jgi:hypothetical protein
VFVRYPSFPYIEELYLLIIIKTVIKKIPIITRKYAAYKNGDPNIARKFPSLSIREMFDVRRRNLLITPITRAAI